MIDDPDQRMIIYASWYIKICKSHMAKRIPVNIQLIDEQRV